MQVDITVERAYVLLFPMSPLTDRFAFGPYLLVVRVGLKAIHDNLSSTSECLPVGHAGHFEGCISHTFTRSLYARRLDGVCFDVGQAFDTVDPVFLNRSGT